MGFDFRTTAFFLTQILILYAYLSYYGPVRPWIFFIESFLMGILAGVLLLLLAPLIHYLFPYSDAYRSAIIKAALIEKAVSFAMISLMIRFFFVAGGMRRFVSAGIHFGAGFAFLENLIYTQNFQMDFIFIRFVSSVPMHLATCGIQAYFLGMARMYDARVNRMRSYLFALFVPLALHGFYDITCHPGAALEIFAGPAIVVSVICFEVLYSRMQNFLTLSDLNNAHLRLEDWFSLQKQLAYAKWILYSSGTRNLPRIPFFRLHSRMIPILVSLLMVVFAAVYWIDPLWYRDFMKVDLGEEYRMALFGIMPGSFAVIFFVVGSVNSEYFKNKRLRIPVVVDVRLQKSGMRIDGIAYEVGARSLFLHTEDFFEVGDRVTVDLHHLKQSSTGVKATIQAVIRNGDPEYPSGMIIDVHPGQPAFQQYYARYLVFRVVKGIVFFFNFSGSHRVRSLFVRPLTVMQSEREYRAGDVIFWQGEKGAQFYLIKKGFVAFFKEIEQGERLKLSELGAGSIFGEMAIVSDNVRSATAECLTDCVIAAAHRDHLDALMQANPEFVLALIKNLIQIILKNETELTRLKQRH